jgi:hypothetical protein
MVFCVDANGIDHDYGVLLWCFASELLKLLHAIIAFVGRSESILGGSGVGAQTFPGLGWTAMDSWKSSKLSSNLPEGKSRRYGTRTISQLHVPSLEGGLQLGSV